MKPTVSVSVVIPCFNCVDTIARAVESVVCQSVRPLEVLLVDDHSTDGTLALLRQLQTDHGHDWIRVVALSENHGAASARNAGWAVARGELIAFLDADDAWHRSKIQIQHAVMSTNSDLLVSGHEFLAPGDNETVVPAATTGSIPFVRLQHAIMVALKNPFITPSIMIRSSSPVRFPEGQRHMEDHLMLMRLAFDRAGMAKIQLPLARIFKNRYGQGGLSAQMQAMHEQELLNLTRLRTEHRLSWTFMVVLRGYARLKFLRRLIRVKFRRG